MRKLLAILVLSALTSLEIKAQNALDASMNQIGPSIERDTIEFVTPSKGNYPKKAKEVLDALQIGGYYRFSDECSQDE